MLFCVQNPIFYIKAHFYNKKHTKKYGIIIDKTEIMLYHIKASFERALSGGAVSRGGAVR